MTKKKILIFSLAYYPKHIGGAEVAIKAITDRCAPEEYEFHMITNRYDSTLPKVEQVGNVCVYRIGFSKRNATTESLFHPLFYLVKILYVPLAAVKALSLHRRNRYDGFWAMMLYMTYPIALLRLLGMRLPYVVSLQEGDTFERVFNRWYVKPFEPILLLGIRRATVVQSISTFLASWATKKGYRGSSIVIPNAVNTKHFTQEYSDAELASARAELGKKDGDVYLVTTSRLVHKNAVDVVVRAIALLPAHVHFVVYGTGPDEVKLTERITQLGISDRVHMRGHIDHSVMPKYLKACDIFIRPSRSEGMGNSFVEAMAAELPVIATQEGGIADFLFDAKRNPDADTTGWAVDPDSPEQIRDAVLDIIEHPDRVAQVVATAKALACEKYDWDVVAQAMQKYIFASIK